MSQSRQRFVTIIPRVPGVVCFLLVLAACGGGSSGPPPDTTPRVTSVAVTPSPAAVVVGAQTQLTATVSAVNGAPTAVSWGTSNAAIATVSATGQVQGVAPGTATITATSTFDATKSGTSTVTVSPPPAVNSVTVAPAAPAIVVGQTLPLTATVAAVGGASTAVTWTSSDPAIVSVSTAGTLTGLAVGTADVTATSVFAPTVSATVPVTVSPAPPGVVSVAVAPVNPTIVVDEVLQLTAAVTVVSGASTAVTWASSNTAVATVAADGEVTAIAVGTTTVTATSTFDATKSGSTNVTVNPKAAVLSVTLTTPPVALIAATTAQLTAVVTVAGGASTDVTWSTSNAAAATVSPTGLVSAVAAGNATITATSVADSTKQASADIRIDATAIVLNVTVGPATLSLAVGAFGQLTATVTVGNNASQQVVWSTNNASVATVDTAGKVTAVAAGSATIRAAAQADNTKFAESVVTVTAPSFPSSANVGAGTDQQFDPAQVDIAVGGSVTWQFASLTHNVTFASATGVPNNIGSSTSTSVSRTFNTAGTFDYQCTLHAGMDGKVVVH